MSNNKAIVNPEKAYLTLRIIHSIWTVVLVPFALIYFKEIGGSGNVFMVQMVSVVYTIIVMVYMEQYFFPVKIQDAIFTVAGNLLNIILGIFFFESFYLGFYLSFVSVVSVLCLLSLAIILMVIFNLNFQNPIFNLKAKGFKDWIYTLFSVSLLTFPFYLGFEEFVLPMFEETLNLNSIFVLLAISIRVIPLMKQVRIIVFQPENPLFAEQRRMYNETWKMVGTIAFLFSLFWVFALSY